MKNKNLYLYPITARNNTGISNPYVSLLKDSLLRYYSILNADHPSRYGIFDLLKYWRKLDIIYLNWIEELPEKHLGVVQSIFFLLLLPILKISPIKIIWTLHNKRSHSKNYPLLKRIIFKQMIKKSDLIITHSEEGLSFIEDKSKSTFIHHPVRKIECKANSDDTDGFDIVIWGSITHYKGVDRFIGFLKDRGILDNYRILIAGKITSGELANRFLELSANSPNLKIMNEFIPEDILIPLIRMSKLVVFTYHSDSVLSSGALMDSLSQSAIILGPNVGAFKDLHKLGLIDTFQDFAQLLQKIDLYLRTDNDLWKQKERIKQFIKENSWENFSEQVNQLIQSLY